MWPWAHAAFGYLLYTGYLRLRAAGRPAGWPVIALVAGTQFPDLVDKPLAWQLHLLPYGRSLTHSLFVALPLVALLIWYTRARGHPALGTAFGLGHLSHLVGDSLRTVFAREFENLAFLVWPLRPIPNVEAEVESVIRHLQAIEADPFFVAGLLLTAVACALWTTHDYPGLRDLVLAVRAIVLRKQ